VAFSNAFGEARCRVIVHLLTTRSVLRPLSSITLEICAPSPGNALEIMQVQKHQVVKYRLPGCEDLQGLKNLEDTFTGGPLRLPNRTDVSTTKLCTILACEPHCIFWGGTGIDQGAACDLSASTPGHPKVTLDSHTRPRSENVELMVFVRNEIASIDRQSTRTIRQRSTQWVSRVMPTLPPS